MDQVYDILRIKITELMVMSHENWVRMLPKCIEGTAG